MEKEYLYLVELIRAEITDCRPQEKPDTIAWENLFQIAKLHMVESLVFAGITRLQKQPEGQIYELWKECADKALVKEISFDAEREQILTIFDQEGIKYVPLKGILLKEYYSRPGLRQFSDNDILYDKKYQKKVEEIMHQLGYEGELSEGNHDVYEKEPIYNFELHTALLPEWNESRIYFDDIWNRVIKDDNRRMAYRMSNEDFYLFHIVHLKNHFQGTGTGLRYFVDQYYLNRKLLTQLHQQEVEEKLSNTGMTEFEKKIRNMTELLFGERTSEWHSIFQGKQQEEKMFLYVMNCGAYGHFQYGVEHAIEKSENKGKYILSRMFLPRKLLSNKYPILKKKPWLYPVLSVWRLVKAPFTSSANVKTEFSTLFHKKKS
jgi:hypothetical protein